MTFELLFLSLTGAADLDLLLTLSVIRAGPRVTGLDAPVATDHQLGTLILATEHCLSQVIICCQVLPALNRFIKTDLVKMFTLNMP